MIAHSGIGTYTTNLLRYLKEIAQLRLRVLGDPNKILQKIPDFKGTITPFYASIYGLKEHIQYPQIERDEILHVPHYNAPFKHLRGPTKLIVTVHDLIHLKSKQFALPHYRLYAYLSLAAIDRWADQVLTVSKSTCKDLLEYFPEMKKKIKVIPNGFERAHFREKGKGHSLSKKKYFLDQYGLPSQYLLHVGIGKKHKNVDFLIRALAPLWRNQSLSLPLVLAGCNSRIPSYVAKEARRNKVIAHIRVMGPLDLAELSLLYECASVFLFPSLIEGFGFPILEAMACGTPVLCSNISALPEVGANAPLYFNPCEEADLQIKLNNILTRETLYKKLVARGKERVKCFRWDTHIAELLEVYRKVQKTV